MKATSSNTRGGPPFGRPFICHRPALRKLSPSWPPQAARRKSACMRSRASSVTNVRLARTTEVAASRWTSALVSYQDRNR